MKRLSAQVSVLLSAILFLCLAQARLGVSDVIQKPYLTDTGVESRSITYENRAGEKGAGGKAASKLGVGRKGSPAVNIAPGATFELCDIKGPGVIRHIWMTTRGEPVNLRSLVIRAYWDGQEHPSIECPLGDFMGIAHGRVVAYQTAVHSVGESAGMNIWLPMPFARKARMTMTNDGKQSSVLFYQIDYTINDKLPQDFGRLHVLFRRENPTTLKKDFELLPQRKGRGSFVGSVIGIRPLSGNWWGEGEVKVYMDGDTEFPTICGTGSEDYVGLSWGIQQTPFMYNGCSLNKDGYVCMYRWHLPDPIYWKKDCRVTIQQIGWRQGLYERQDDWSCATFWYEPIPSQKLPAMPGVKERTADIVPPPKKEK
ncbi:DUF2961 domain-containing protein [bacterium]|nr:DUF2961 domain-containing protein [bacterium]